MIKLNVYMKIYIHDCLFYINLFQIYSFSDTPSMHLLMTAPWNSIQSEESVRQSLHGNLLLTFLLVRHSVIVDTHMQYVAPFI